MCECIREMRAAGIDWKDAAALGEFGRTS